MRALLGLVLALVFAGCASNRPAQAPVGRAQTTGAPLDQPTYGVSDTEEWSAPAATGNATHGSATSPAPRPAAPPPPPR